MSKVNNSNRMFDETINAIEALLILTRCSFGSARIDELSVWENVALIGESIQNLRKLRSEEQTSETFDPTRSYRIKTADDMFYLHELRSDCITWVRNNDAGRSMAGTFPGNKILEWLKHFEENEDVKCVLEIIE